jgi:hypothetical protein
MVRADVFADLFVRIFKREERTVYSFGRFL